MSAVTVLLTIFALLMPSGFVAGADQHAGACTSVVQNGGFEQGDLMWTGTSSGGYDIVSPFLVHTGASAAYLAGYNDALDELVQDIHLPAGQMITLRLWSYVSTAETIHPWDSLVVSATPAGAASQTLLHLDDGSVANTWRESIVDLTGLAGKQIQLSFAASTDETNVTSFFVDDVEIMACPTGEDGGQNERRYLPFIGRAGV